MPNTWLQNTAMGSSFTKKSLPVPQRLLRSAEPTSQNNRNLDESSVASEDDRTAIVASRSATEQNRADDDTAKSQDPGAIGPDARDATAVDDNNKPDAKTKPVIDIVNARFGTGKKWVDVTENIKSIFERDPPIFINSAKGMRTADPISGYRKKTIITFRINGKQKQITLPAGPSRKYNLADQLK